MSAYISLPMYGASIDQRLRLVGERDPETDEIIYPKRPRLNGSTPKSVTLSGEGEIYTFSVIAAGGAPAEFDDQQIMTGVITVAVVQLKEGPRLMAQIVDAEPNTLDIGTPVQAVMRRLYKQEGIIRYGIKFTPSTQRR